MRSPATQVDVLVLGGGPGGASTALALRRHAPSLSVALAESTNYSNPRIGETLAPVGRTVLEQLGVWAEFQQQAYLPSYGTRAIWGSPIARDNEYVFSARGEGWHLDRRAFDQFLADACRSRGVNVVTGATADSATRRDDSTWRVGLNRGDSTRIGITTRIVVDATGRRAWFARKYGGVSTMAFDRLVASFAVFQFADESPQPDSLTRVEADEMGWWYSAALAGQRAAVAFMTDSDLVPRLRLKKPGAWLGRLRSTKDISCFVAGANLACEPRLFAAHSRLLGEAAGPSWLAVGDASSTWDPLSSLGILKAMRAGTFAAYAIADHFQGKRDGLARFNQHVKAEFNSYLKIRSRYYAEEQRWPESPFWKRRTVAEPLHA